MRHLQILLTNGENLSIDNLAHYPDPAQIDFVEEPWVKCHIMAPAEYLGAIMSLGMEKRGDLLKTETMDANRLLLTYRLPMNEIITDFNDKLKSVTRGYGSFDYEFDSYEKAISSNSKSASMKSLSTPFPALSTAPKPNTKGRAICAKLIEVIPQQLFKVPVQAAIGGK